MFTTFDDIIIILACVFSSLAFVWMLQRVWPSANRRMHNDLIGWHVTVLGTTYAVIIGFMLYAVWTTYQVAEVNADAEANCLVNVFRLADGLPETQRVQVHQMAREYADVVINQEWPAMNRAESSFAAQTVLEKLWVTVVQTKPATFTEQTSMNLLLTEISTMTQHRRLRILQSESKLPGILWLLMILGGGITTLSACLFGTENERLHLVQVFSLTLLISLALIAVGDIDRPFQGAVHVSSMGFERARGTLAAMPAEER